MIMVQGVVETAKGATASTVTIVVPAPAPAPGPGGAVMGVQACEVCDTDLRYREEGIRIGVVQEAFHRMERSEVPRSAVLI
jgi:D-arabinose 1-dehydrogenase-like Zn-dependent alcohol dehydrogenase